MPETIFPGDLGNKIGLHHQLGGRVRILQSFRTAKISVLGTWRAIWSVRLLRGLLHNVLKASRAKRQFDKF